MTMCVWFVYDVSMKDFDSTVTFEGIWASHKSLPGQFLALEAKKKSISFLRFMHYFKKVISLSVAAGFA